MWITQVSLRNPVFAVMVMLALVVLGSFSYQRMKVDQFPDVDFPVVVVTVDYPGASPEIVESEVTRKVEESVNAIAGINALTSRSYPGTSVVIIEFQLTVDGRRAAEDVREKIAALRPLLRDEVDEPRVQRFDPADQPIWLLAVQPDPRSEQAPDLIALSSWTDQVLRKRLENVRGVGSVTLIGGTRREIHIELQPQAMESLGVSASEVVAAVRNENQDLPLGALRSPAQERALEIDARMVRPEDFGSIIVGTRQGTPVLLGQVAKVRDGAEELENLALFNGQRTLLLQVQKVQDDNTIEVVDGLRQVLQDIGPELPPGVSLREVGDAARPIRVAVDNVRATLIEGALLTILIVFLFLNSWRSTVITGLTLPVALIGTFWFMNMFGFTINMITLMALSLCVGLLIDDAIVVRENIVRHVQMGKSPYRAAAEGTHEIGLAVLATTSSIVAVFLPIGFMGGIIGQFFHQFGITIAVAVLISMFVSFTLDPMLSSIWHDPAIHAAGAQPNGRRSLYDRTLGRVTHAFDRFTTRLSDGYQHVLRWSLRHRLATLGAAIAIFVGSVMAVPLLGTEFVPQADFSQSSVAFNTPVGSSLETTEAKARQIQAILSAMPEVRYSTATVNAGASRGKIYGSVAIRWVDRHERDASAQELSARLRQRLADIPGIVVTHVGVGESVGGENKQISFSLLGPDQAELERLNTQALAVLRGIPGLVDLDSSAKPDNPNVVLDVNRQAAAALGLGVAPLASTLRTMVAGETVGNWRAPDNETYDVKVRLPLALRNTPEDLARIPLVATQNEDGSPRIVRVNQVAQIRESTGASQINRRALNREVSITANAYGRSVGEVSADITRVMQGIAMPPGYRYQFSGATKDMQESFAYAVSALAMAIIFIYMILASQFKSFVQPLAIMTSLPLTLVGVVLALMLFGSSLSMFSVIGVVMLMGLVTKNAILLVDFAIRARSEHIGEDGLPAAALSRSDALLAAARVRMRPILMTTLAMIFGMVPLAFAFSEGSEQRAPMGQAVIGGLITSSLLTLVVVPVVYSYLDDGVLWLRRRWRR